MKLYISTGGEKTKTAFETLQNWKSYGFTCLELSGGVYSENWRNEILSVSNEVEIQIHNYFPPPRNAFVFNLASLNQKIAEKSIEHVRKAIQFSAELGSPRYSFHAGYLLDPEPAELGKNISVKPIADREISIEIFIERVKLLSKEAERLGVELLIENNVLSSNNYAKFGTDPLLMTTPSEIDLIMKEMPRNVGLLLDVAHLKVSACSLQFNMVDALLHVSSWVKAYHLSDNEGKIDSNDPVRRDSWFWEYLEDVDCYTLEVYGLDNLSLLNQQNLAMELLPTVNSLNA